MLFFKNKVVSEEGTHPTSIVNSVDNDNVQVAPPNPFLVSRESIFKADNYDENLRMNEKIDRKLLTDGISIPRNITYVDINLIQRAPYNWNPYKFYDPDDRDEIKITIQNFGMVYPIILHKDRAGTYMCLDGQQRLNAYLTLFEETADEKYKNVPALVFDVEELNEVFAREVILNSNSNKRPTSYERTQIILEKFGIMRLLKERRNELNIYEFLARNFGISKGTVNNYRKLENCLPQMLYLLDISYINLTAARKIAGYSKEVQQVIIDTVGLLDIRTCLIRTLPKKLNMMNVKNLVKYFMTLEDPVEMSITIKGLRKDILRIRDNFANIVNDLDIKKINLSTSKDRFDFMTGYSHLGNRQLSVPSYYHKFLTNEPIFEQRNFTFKSR